MCGTRWQHLADFVTDRDLVVNGYQASFSDSVEGLFVVTHDCENCGTTIAIKAGKFKELYGGPDYSEFKFDSSDCEGHCLDENDFGTCSQECGMRWVRVVLQVLKSHGAPVDWITKNNSRIIPLDPK
ncbi:hypothetical protein K8I28_02950 [bacterium]|nr:hypothetical protein [bacterium]